MKTATFILLLVLTAATAFAQPDPRDSVILESKLVAPGVQPGGTLDSSAYLHVRVWITNRDSLIGLFIPLVEVSASGGAYATLAHPRGAFVGVTTPLTETLTGSRTMLKNNYHGNDPDSFAIQMLFDATDPATVEPPNPVRKTFLEIKFDTVQAAEGIFELDSLTTGGVPLGFYTTVSNNERLDVNFVKSIITVVAAPKGDFNSDFSLSPADAVWLLSCVYLGKVPPAGMAACDLNCDGLPSPADIALELNAIFLGGTFPC